MAANSIGNASLKLSTDGGNLTQGLSKTAGEIKSFAANSSASLKGVGGGVAKSITGGLAGIGGKLAGFLKAGPHIAAIAGIGLAIYTAVSAPFDKLKELGGISKQADVLGISASQLGGLTKQFQRVGIEAEEVNGIIAKMGKNIYDAAGGHGKADKALQQLSINAKQLKDLAPDEQFKKIADEIAKLPPGAAQASAALHIFGDSGAQLLSVLQKGSAGIQEFINEQKKTGSVLSDAQFKAAADAQKAWKESRFAITEVWDGLVNRATLIAAPIVKFVGGAVSKAFALVTPIFEWLGRAMEQVSVILERVGEVVMVWFNDVIAEVKLLIGEVQSFTGEWPTVEVVVTQCLKGVGIMLAYVWDTLKAGTGAIAFVVGWLVKGFGSLVDTFKATIKDLLEIAGKLPDELGGDWFRKQAANVDSLGSNIKAAGDKLVGWGKNQMNDFGNSAERVEKWFNKLKLQRDDIVKKAQKLPDAVPAKYEAVAAHLKGSKEAYSIETHFKYDQKFGKKDNHHEKALDEAKKGNKHLGKIAQLLDNGKVLMAA